MNSRVQCPARQCAISVRNQRLGEPSAWLSSSRRFSQPLAAASALFLVGGVLAGALLFSGCGGYSEPAAEKPDEPAETKPEPPPPPKPIGLAKLSPVKLDPGQGAEVELEVARNENKGAVQVEVSGLPEGVSTTSLEIPADESAGKLELTAAQKLGDAELKATLTVTAKLGELEAEQPLELTVNKVNLPSFQPAAQVILQPGVAKTVNLTVQRSGYAGPLELRVADLPEKLSATVESIPADQSAAKVEITAAGDIADGDKTFRVTATLYGRNVEVSIPVKIDRTPYQVNSFMVVTIKPGGAKPVEVPVVRKSYKGPLTLEVTDLPEGVSIAKVEVPANQAKAKLMVTATPNAKESVRSAKVVSTGGSLKRTDPLIVRVSHGEGGFLPREVTADPESSMLLRRGSFGGRLTNENKQALVNAFGGTKESEEAVLRGLRWLAAHQGTDGGWSLNNYAEGLQGCDCDSDEGDKVEKYDTAGTAFGALCFLGAGITHKGGPDKPLELVEYRKRVFSAIRFLTRNQVGGDDKKKAGNLGGNMYAHALGTMALCEAYGLSGDENLRVYAQMAVRYLAESQHKEGGWRYGPNQAGDMSATAWVFLAIRSSQLAGLPIGRSSLIRAERFVDSCAVGPEGSKRSRYSYTPPTAESPQSARLALSAAGLLTRQYLGSKKDDPDLLAGCRYLAGNLPPQSASALGEIYYYHYATQVLHHMEGTEFDLWNHRMREHLLRTQETEGHKAGSWSPKGAAYGDRGGRIYSTAMALLTLETYYRHLPMYRTIDRTVDRTGG